MRYYIIAGEASGDLHGSNLIRQLLSHDPEAKVRYWGGYLMAEASVSAGDRATCVKHISQLAYMGFVEVATHLKTITDNIRFCKEDIRQYNPDAIIYIDYPGFNLKIAKYAHRLGYRNYHYISPQLWAWKKGRIRTMRTILDKLYYILPFERDFYADNHFPQAEYVGHPLLDAVQNYTAAPLGIDCGDRPIIALLPGSRKQELRKMLPQMVRVASRHPQYHFIIAGMSLIGEHFYRQLLHKTPDNVDIVYDKTYTLLANSHAAIVCSGTATLETALFNVPQVVCYRANPISIAIARLVVGRRIRYISLVNLIADRPVVTELLQSDLTDQNIDKELLRIAVEGEPRREMLEGYREVRVLLGDGGASERVAKSVIENTRASR